MIPKIDIFNETGNGCYYQALLDAIAQLSTQKPETNFRNFKESEQFIQFLKSQSRDANGKLELVTMINLGFGYKPFVENSQKIILTNETGYHNNIVHNGLTGGRLGDQFGNPAHREAIALSTARLDPDQFFAIACHEFGHIYGATRFRKNNIKITNEGIHCVNNGCAMNLPAYNSRTNFNRRSKTLMYCPDCQDGIRNY